MEDAKEARAYTAGSKAYPEVPSRRRRGPMLLVGLGIVLFIVYFSSSSVSNAAAGAARHLPPAPQILPERLKKQLPKNPFTLSAPAAHEPPVQKNSSSGDASWFSDWHWKKPFSWSTTLDEDRSVLPPLADRLPVYTYYSDIDGDGKPKAKDVVEAEREILKVWRRSWWAKGFRPVVLGPVEAMAHPAYKILETVKMKLDPPLKAEIMRWLAYAHMGRGVLANYVAIPMASRASVDLAFLRRGRFAKIGRFEGMGSALFYSGEKKEIERVVLNVLAVLGKKGADAKSPASLIDLVEQDTFAVEPRPTGIAFYEAPVLSDRYTAVAERIRDAPAEGMRNLALLMNAHLHQTFLKTAAAGGIEVVNPQTQSAAILAGPAVRLAAALNVCPSNPVHGSCPPNARRPCLPCEPRKVSYREGMSNSSASALTVDSEESSVVFTIGVVAHPYTLNSLVLGKTDLSVGDVRRRTDRDQWLERATAETMTQGISAYARIVAFKDEVVASSARLPLAALSPNSGDPRGSGAVASGNFAATVHRSIWHAAEYDWTWRDLEWRFGFALPHDTDADTGGDKKGGGPRKPAASQSSSSSSSDQPIHLPSVRVENAADPPELEPYLRGIDRRPNHRSLVRQAEVVAAVKKVITSSKSGGGRSGGGAQDVRKAVEAWNLADSEAWRFVRALEARERMERVAYEAEEGKFGAVNG